MDRYSAYSQPLAAPPARPPAASPAAPPVAVALPGPPHRPRKAGDRLLLVMPYHQLARKAAEAGFRVWSIWDPEEPEADFLAEVEEVSEELVLTSFADEARLRRLVAATARRTAAGTVLHCGHGASVRPVVEEAWRLGLSPNPPEAYRAEAYRAGAYRAEAADGGSGDVPADVPRVQVQTLTVAGEHHVVGVSAQRTSGPPSFTVTGYVHPAPLPGPQRAAVERLAVSVLRAGNHRFGPAYTEIALTADGPRVVGCALRFSPHRVPLLVQVATGFDYEAALFEVLRGRPVRVLPAHQYAELGFFLLPEGRLLAHSGMENVAVTPWVRGARFPYAVGDRVPSYGRPAARRGYVVVEGDSPECTQERIRLARADVLTDIRTDSGAEVRTGTDLRAGGTSRADTASPVRTLGR